MLVEMTKDTPKRITIHPGDIVLWEDTPYLVVSCVNTFLVSFEGGTYANGTFKTLNDLEESLNRKIQDGRNIIVFPRTEYKLVLERRE